MAIGVSACAGYGMPEFIGAGAPRGSSDDGTSGGDEKPSPVSIARVTDLGPLKESPDILGRDGGLSGVFDGRSVWLFGDTLFRVRKSGETGWLSNSFAWAQDLDATDGIDFVYPTTPEGKPQVFLPDSDAEHQFNLAHASESCTTPPCGAHWGIWPVALVADPERARTLVFYGKIYAEIGLFNFSWVGQSMAVWRDLDATPARVTDDDSQMMFRDADRAYGNAAVVDGDDLYVYGCGSGEGHRNGCRVARVPLEDALDLRAWKYYAGGGAWTAAGEKAIPVLEANGILSVAYNVELGKYLAVYTEQPTNHVMMRTSKRPEGPWSDAVAAFTTRTPSRLWVYDARAHPEFEREGGRVQYVSYSLATGDWTSEMRLAEVELGTSESVTLAVLRP